jgi:hypothetical protein
MSNSIINSLKRLERAGQENSRYTQKVREATSEVADLIATCSISPLTENLTLLRELDIYPLGKYSFVRGMQGKVLMKLNDEILNSSGFANSDKPSRDTCLEFAKDIADGLIDTIAEEVESENKKIQEAEGALENAKARVKE